MTNEQDKGNAFGSRFDQHVRFARSEDCVSAPVRVERDFHQVCMIGALSLPLITTSGFAIGVVLSMHTRAMMERFGAASMIPSALAYALFSDTGPLMTGLLVSGRVGAGIGAELGGMRVTEQVDALESLAVDSFHYLAVTRIVACMIALPILTTVLNFSGLIGGFLAETAVSNISLRLYFRQAFSSIAFTGYVAPTVKQWCSDSSSGWCRLIWATQRPAARRESAGLRHAAYLRR